MINKQDNDNNNDKKRIALITGANRGIGFEVCRQLAQLPNNMTVILTARDFEKGQSATRLLKVM